MSGTEDADLRLTRAPVDRLLVGCVIALTLAYAGWLAVMQWWPRDPASPDRQSFLGFVSGSSQPPTGAGEESPAAAGEVGSSKRGSSGYYYGSGTPRPVAEGARIVDSPASKPEPPQAKPPQAAPRKLEFVELEQPRDRQPEAPSSASRELVAGEIGTGAGDAKVVVIGRLGLADLVLTWIPTNDWPATHE